MTSLRKIRRGDRVIRTAELHNATVDAIEFAQKRVTGGTGYRFDRVVRIKNSLGYALQRYDVIGIGDVAITPAQNLSEFKRQITFQAEEVAQGEAFGVVQQPIPNGGYGKVVTHGMTQVRLTGTGDFAQVVVGATYMQASAGGPCRVIWSESGSAERWAVVRLDMLPLMSGVKGWLPNDVSITSDSNLSLNQIVGPWSVADNNTDFMRGFDYEDYFDPATPNWFTVPRDGVYLVGATVSWAPNSNGCRVIAAQAGFSGVADYARSAIPAINNANTAMWQTTSSITEMDAGSTCALFATQDSGSTLTINDEDPLGFIGTTYWIWLLSTTPGAGFNSDFGEF